MRDRSIDGEDERTGVMWSRGGGKKIYPVM